MSKPLILSTAQFIQDTKAKLETLDRRPVATRALKATIDPMWTAGLPQVIIDGEDFTRTAGYPWDPGVTGSWIPAPGQRVYVVPLNPDGWIIAGPIIESRPLMNVQKLAPYRASVWTDFDAAWREWYVSKSTAEITILGGVAKCTSAVSQDDLILTLPAAFVPVWDAAERVRYPVDNSENPNAVDVWGDGRVTAAVNIASGTYISLSGIAFPDLNSGAVYTPIGDAGSGAAAEFAGGWFAHANASFSQPGFWMDPYGWTFWKGHITNPASIIGVNTPMVLLNDPTLLSSHGQIHSISGYAAGLGIVGYCDVSPFNVLSWRTGTSWTAAGYLDLGGVYGQTAAADSYLYEPSASLANGWSDYGSGNYFDFGHGVRPDGIAAMHGLIKGGTVPASFATVVAGSAWMPSGVPSMRPKGFNGQMPSASSGLFFARPTNSAFGRLDIRSDGTEYVQSGSATWFSLDGVFWAPEW